MSLCLCVHHQTVYNFCFFRFLVSWFLKKGKNQGERGEEKKIERWREEHYRGCGEVVESFHHSLD